MFMAFLAKRSRRQRLVLLFALLLTAGLAILALG